MALVIVLAMLVLLSGVLVAFMTSVTTEHNSTTANANVVATRQIADNTTNLVIAQIREATTRYTDTATWASQPGAIRVLSGGQKGGNKVSIPPAGAGEGVSQYQYFPGKDDWVYKLYSSEQMRVKADDYQPAAVGMKDEIDTIKDWVTKPNPKYVDLNEPVLTPRTDLNTGTNQFVDPRYPIIDPRASFDVNEKPTAAGAPGIVEGFAAKTTNLLAAGSKVLTLANQPVPSLPMPAQWLYVLRDGSILGPDAVKALGTKLETNPIVGRTAFWVDDESCKVNLNTASEGTFWDTPVVSTEQDSGNVSTAGAVTSSATSMSLAASQPAKGEYQRYPGHPATTCLSPVLGWLWNTNGVPFAATANLSDPVFLTFKDSIYQMSPFLPAISPTTLTPGYNTSYGGRDNPDKDRPDNKGISYTVDKTAIKHNILTKHLYANADEFIFQPGRNTGGANPVTLLNPKVTPQALEKVRFFLTANSRAPELNVFNRPRVTFWPVSLPGPKDPPSTTRRTNFDNLFSFTSTIGGKSFNFVRFYARDATTDMNAPQNVAMFSYLTWLTGDNGRRIPGFGDITSPNNQNFNGKYRFEKSPGVSERNQILALIYDYCRSVNLVDTGTGKVGVNRFISYTPFFGQGQAGYGGVSNRSYDWSGQVTPGETSVNHPLGAGLHGLGRFATLSQAALVFTRAGDVVGGVQKNMQAVLLLEMNTPMPGYPALRQTFWTRVRGGGKNVDGSVLGPPKMKVGANTTEILPTGSAWDNITNISSHEVGYGRAFMPTHGFINQVYYFPEHKDYTYPELYPADTNFNPLATVTRKTFARDPSTAPGAYLRNKSVTFYPYVSDLASLTNAAGETFDLVEGAFEVEIYTGEGPGDPRSTKVQTITLKFPRANAINVPLGQGAVKADFGLRPPSPEANKDNTTWVGGLPPLRDTDVVRAIEYIGTNSVGAPLSARLGADLRIAQMRPVLTANDYQPRDLANYTAAAAHRVHGFHWGHGDAMAGFDPAVKPSAMAPGGTRNYKPFILPAGVNGVQRTDLGPGDYDRGISKHMDYAGGNKVDEGNVYFGYGDNDLGGRLPYFRGRGIEEVGQSFFTPNRQLPSAVMFGSLPSGGLEGKPWQTLLFRPDRPAVGGTNHPGANLPEDHLLLDLFHLPIIEPYAISEPFSTAGKINLNYIMAPYGYLAGVGTFGKDKVPNAYIRRDTGLRAVLKSTKFLAVPTDAPNAAHNETPVDQTAKYRFDIDLDNTIAKIEQRFTDPKLGVFRSASEICTVDLYPANPLPAGKTLTAWGKFWETDFAQTGDNMRERPYAHIYPRVTTKSNVFTVHMRCQTIRQARRQASDSYEFDEKKDQIVSEYRGSSIIERFVDPSDPDLKNYDYRSTGTASPGSVDPYYRFRVVNTKQFAPR